MDTDRRQSQGKRHTFEQLKADLLRRLRRVCATTADEDLERLAVRMTRLRLKYDRDTAVPSSFLT